MTVRATLTAAFPEARRISEFLDRDFGQDGVPVSLDEGPGGRWSVDAYFDRDDADEVADEIRDRLGADAFGAPLEAIVLPETDWIAEGLRALQPVEAGRFVVHGSHDRGQIRRGRVAIEIDAGQAFGTGHHGTTAGCLTVLDGLMRVRRFENPLDLGTGSGLLAIAMAKQLRVPVLATDIDPVAVRVARENAALNTVGPLVETAVAPGMAHPAIRRRAPFDLIVANILAEPLMRLAPAVAAALRPDGLLVLSGLLRHQRERVVAAYGMQGVYLRSARLFDGWAVLVLGRGPD
ncbi:50S ribosomal protein L11 methyltransferase [Faunimonas sp. B44]|uniref:50S ribosomal protein L11 methyltransferase n=1 Tax=Faunimonas sp. B44 TaxID=3461493 RepID=UPI00404483B7